MRVAHLADLHLGFRRYDRVTPAGVNVRQDDVARTFIAAIDALVALQPDLIVIAGDVFHYAKPGNRATQLAFEQFARLRRSCAAEVVIAAGNHDQPASREESCMLGLLANVPGVRVATRETRSFGVRVQDTIVDVTAVPEGAAIPEFQKTGDYAVLVLHGEAPNLIHGSTAETFDPAMLVGWDYVALGHLHCHRQIEADVPAYYAGSIDYTSSDVWGELVEQEQRGVPGKGFVLHDLETGEHEFIPLPASRLHIDRRITAHGLTAADLNAKIAEICDSIPLDGVVVRIVIDDCPRLLIADLDQRPIRRYKARALDLKIDWRKPEVVRVGSAIPAARSGNRRGLMDIVHQFLSERGLTDDVSREEFVAAGAAYLAEADGPINVIAPPATESTHTTTEHAA